MEANGHLKPEMARFFAAKEARRRKLAALPFPEKVRTVMCLLNLLNDKERGTATTDQSVLACARKKTTCGGIRAQDEDTILLALRNTI